MNTASLGLDVVAVDRPSLPFPDHRCLGVSYPTAWYLHKRLRQLSRGCPANPPAQTLATLATVNPSHSPD
jgi:hypothetical protein